MNNILDCKSRDEFRSWLESNAAKEKECFVYLVRGKPKDDGKFYYLDAVEEALCFGWIDSCLKKVDGVLLQRFSPRSKNSPWTELNKARARRLIALGKLTALGKASLPDIEIRPAKLDKSIEKLLIKNGALELFLSFPLLYRNIRIYNLSFYKKKNNALYRKALKNFLKMTSLGQMYGQWDDYGRLG